MSVPPINNPQRPTTPSRGDTLRTPAAPTARAVAMPIEQPSWTEPSQLIPIILLFILTAMLIVAYLDMFDVVATAWMDSGIYSQGWVIPVFALGLLWLRWQPFTEVPAGERWLGVALIAGGLLFRLVAAKYFVNVFDRLSFMPCIFGIFLLVGGFRTIQWAWPALGFLIFMFPLPTLFEVRVLGFLQKIASVSSTFVLQVLGVAAFREGNLISIPGMDTPLTVADACSGLKMATIFGALAVAMVFVIERPWWDKFVILLSAIPIALIVNIVRITVTGLLYMVAGPKNVAVQKICHDYAGILIMMPLAMALLWLELQILERITIPVETVQLRPVGGLRGVANVPIR